MDSQLAMTTLVDLSRTLLDAQNQVGIGRSEMAALAGISRITLRHALAGEDFRVSTLLALADKLGLDVALVPQSVSHAMQTAQTRQPPQGRRGSEGADESGAGEAGGPIGSAGTAGNTPARVPLSSPRTTVQAALDRIRARQSNGNNNDKT
jgi:hypothetical protein